MVVDEARGGPRLPEEREQLDEGLLLLGAVEEPLQPEAADEVGAVAVDLPCLLRTTTSQPLVMRRKMSIPQPVACNCWRLMVWLLGK